LISTVSAGSSNFTKGRTVSPTNPITLTGGKPIQPIIYFPQAYQVMELNVVTLQKITFVKVLIGNVPTLLTGLVTANSDGSNQYVVTVPPELIQPTNKITLFISYTDTINVVGFTIKACTGNTLFLLNIEMILSSNLFNFSL
jgi:hypothetical protein